MQQMIPHAFRDRTSLQEKRAYSLYRGEIIITMKSGPRLFELIGTYVISSLVQNASNTILLHNDIIRIFPLYKAYPTVPCPRYHLKTPNILAQYSA